MRACLQKAGLHGCGDLGVRARAAGGGGIPTGGEELLNALFRLGAEKAGVVWQGRREIREVRVGVVRVGEFQLREVREVVEGRHFYFFPGTPEQIGDPPQMRGEEAARLPEYPSGLSLDRAQEREVDGLLRGLLLANDCIQTLEESLEREGVLLALRRSISLWVYLKYAKLVPQSVSGFQPRDELLPPGRDAPESYLTLLLPYGSYYLGVNSKDGDLDCIVLLPKFVVLSDFLAFVPSYLLGKHPEIRFHEVVRSHNANLVTLQYGEVYVDLQPVIVDVERITPAVDVLDDYLLRGLSDQAVRALNGLRTNILIKRALGERFSVFREVLMLLKLFVKRRGLSGNKAGFFGGINLSLLLANMFVKAQVPRDTSLVRCLYAFFTVYSAFPWGESFIVPTPGNRVPEFNCAVLSAAEAERPVNQGVRSIDSSLLQQQWRPTPAAMTILTLAPPVMNSSLKVYPCSREAICSELSRARGRLLRSLLAAQQAFRLLAAAGEPGESGDRERANIQRSAAVLRPCLFAGVFAPITEEFFTQKRFRSNYLCVRLSHRHLGPSPTVYDQRWMEKAVSLADSRLIGIFLALQRQCQEAEAAEAAEATLAELQLGAWEDAVGEGEKGGREGHGEGHGERQAERQAESQEDDKRDQCPPDRIPDTLTEPQPENNALPTLGTIDAVLLETDPQGTAAAGSRNPDPGIAENAAPRAQEPLPGMETIEMLSRVAGSSGDQRAPGDPGDTGAAEPTGSTGISAHQPPGEPPGKPPSPERVVFSAPPAPVHSPTDRTAEPGHKLFREARLTFFRPLPHWFNDGELFSPESIAARAPGDRTIGAWHFTGLCISPGDSSVSLQQTLDRVRHNFLEGLRTTARTYEDGPLKEILMGASVQIVGRSELPEKLRFSRRQKAKRSKQAWCGRGGGVWCGWIWGKLVLHAGVMAPRRRVGKQHL